MCWNGKPGRVRPGHAATGSPSIQPARIVMTPQGGAQTHPTQPIPPPRLSRGTVLVPRDEEMSNQVLQEALTAAKQVGIEHVVIGGCALRLLGSPRRTKDIDLLVPDGMKKDARAGLRQSGSFLVGEGGRQLFKASDRQVYNVDIVEPRKIGLSSYPDKRHIMDSGGVRVLKPALLLNLKVIAWGAELRNENKRVHDSTDIRFLLEYMYDRKMKTNRAECDRVDADVVSTFIGNYPNDARMWRDIGFDTSQASSLRKPSTQGSNGSGCSDFAGLSQPHATSPGPSIRARGPYSGYGDPRQPRGTSLAGSTGSHNPGHGDPPQSRRTSPAGSGAARASRSSGNARQGP